MAIRYGSVRHCPSCGETGIAIDVDGTLKCGVCSAPIDDGYTLPQSENKR